MKSSAEKRRPSGRRNAETLAATLKLADGAGFLVRVVGSRATSAYERLTRQAEITPQQFGVLLTLRQRGGLTLTELADAVYLDRSTLGEMVRRMATRGLVRRQGNGADRRSIEVAIAPAGGTALLRLVEGAAALQDELLAPIPPEDRRLFLHHLKQVALAPGTAPDGPPADTAPIVAPTMKG